MNKKITQGATEHTPAIASSPAAGSAVWIPIMWNSAHISPLEARAPRFSKRTQQRGAVERTAKAAVRTTETRSSGWCASSVVSSHSHGGTHVTFAAPEEVRKEAVRVEVEMVVEGGGQHLGFRTTA